MPWFRLYAEMLEDPKIGTLSDAEFRTWIEILCLACQAGNNGSTDLTVSETEWKLRRNVSETVSELLKRGIVTLHPNDAGKEIVTVAKWKKRQYQSDISTDRVRRFREKQGVKRQ